MKYIYQTMWWQREWSSLRGSLLRRLLWVDYSVFFNLTETQVDVKNVRLYCENNESRNFREQQFIARRPLSISPFTLLICPEDVHSSVANERKVYWISKQKSCLLKFYNANFNFEASKGRNVNRLWRHSVKHMQWPNKCFEFSQKCKPEMKRFVRPLTLLESEIVLGKIQIWTNRSWSYFIPNM